MHILVITFNLFTINGIVSLDLLLIVKCISIVVFELNVISHSFAYSSQTFSI